PLVDRQPLIGILDREEAFGLGVLLDRRLLSALRLVRPEVDELVPAAAPVGRFACPNVVPERQQEPPERDQVACDDPVTAAHGWSVPHNQKAWAAPTVISQAG